jgi:hypothetical protein
MKKFLFLLSFIITLNKSYCQNLIAYDYMETCNWLGLWWGNTPNSTWFTNFSVSPNGSAVIYGSGGGNSSVEQDWYVLPNITGLNPNSQYEFRFRLASYRVTSTANTRGVDVADFVDVQVSYDGELSYTSELRITGNSNAFWDYNTNGTITHMADGVFNSNLSPIGDVYRSGAGNQQFTGPSVITLILPSGITQVAIDILCRVNAAGEEWWLDDIELWEIPNNALSVTLTSFISNCNGDSADINWTTSSEYNSSHYSLQNSRDGQNWVEVAEIQSSGTTNQTTNYSYQGKLFGGISYYRLVQVDFDGQFEIFGPISVNCETDINNIRVYPNPSSNTISIQMMNQLDETMNLTILDFNGKIIFEKTISTQVIEQIDLKDYMNGVYTFIFSSINQTYTTKIIKI